MKGLYTTDPKESNLKIYVPPPSSLSCMRVPYRFFRDGRDSGFLSQMKVVFGIGNMHGMRDAQNNHRDYGTEGKIWFGMTGLKNPIRRART